MLLSTLSIYKKCICIFITATELAQLARSPLHLLGFFNYFANKLPISMIKNAATVFSKSNLFGRIVAAKLKDPYFPLKHAIWKFDCF